jgi:hypothetical protein
MKDTLIDKGHYSKEIAFIGTGPLTLLKAYLLAKSNPDINITLFDCSDQLGGAWYSDKSPLGNEIECGCHIWSHVPSAYNFIEKELGIKLYRMKPNPVFIKGKIRLPYALKLTMHSYKALIKTLVTFNWKHFKTLAKDPEINYRIIGKYNRYPKLGSPELISALKKKIESLSNINLQFNTSIELFDVDQKVYLKSLNRQYEFDHVYITYVSRINSLQLNKQSILVESTKVDYIHFLISLNKPLLKPISYWRLLDDKVIHRLTDISYQTNHTENLILLGIKGSAYDKDKEPELVEHVTRFLKLKNLIDESFTVEKIKTHLFPTYYLSKNTLAALANHPKQVTLLHTTDLTCGFHFLLEKEMLLIKGA